LSRLQSLPVASFSVIVVSTPTNAAHASTPLLVQPGQTQLWRETGKKKRPVSGQLQLGCVLALLVGLSKSIIHFDMSTIRGWQNLVSMPNYHPANVYLVVG